MLWIPAAADDYKAAEKHFMIMHTTTTYFRSTKALQNSSIKGLVRNSTGLQVDLHMPIKTNNLCL